MLVQTWIDIGNNQVEDKEDLLRIVVVGAVMGYCHLDTVEAVVAVLHLELEEAVVTVHIEIWSCF